MIARVALRTPLSLVRSLVGCSPDASCRRILLTRVQNLGDCVVFLPTVNRVRDAFPDARIDILAGTRVGEAVFRMCPSVDGLVTTAWPHPRSRREKLQEIGAIQSGRYGTVLISTEETGSAMKMCLAGIPRRIGFRRIEHMGEIFTESRPWLLSRALEQPDSRHEAEVNLQLADAVGCPETTPEYRLVPPVESEQAAGDLMSEKGLEPRRFICVHAGTKQVAKRWPPEAFAGACDAAAASGLKVAFVGTAEEQPIVQSVRALMRETSLDLTGQTGVPELAALFGRAAGFLGNDSGPMHLAAACGVPVAAIFVASDPAVWGPYCPAERRRVFGEGSTSAEVAEGLLEMTALRQDAGRETS